MTQLVLDTVNDLRVSAAQAQAAQTCSCPVIGSEIAYLQKFFKKVQDLQIVSHAVLSPAHDGEEHEPRAGSCLLMLGV